MKTRDLIGADLDAWIAKAERHIIRQHESTRSIWRDHGDNHPEFLGYLGADNVPPVYSPSTNPAQGHRIIERERIDLRFFSGGHPPGSPWCAFAKLYRAAPNGHGWMWGETALVAAMRAHVFWRYGEEVPDEITTTKETERPR